MSLLAALGAALALAPAPGPGPAFDCARAASPGERLVCGDPALSTSDRTMATRYATALARASDPAGLRAAQRSALAQRDACETRECVANWYAVRIRALAHAALTPNAPHACVEARVERVGPRVEGAPESGVAIGYTGGLAQVTYDAGSLMASAQVGDPVRLCLVSRPRHCPAGDVRGSVYAARDGRTGARWTAADSSHLCGGA